GLRHGKVSTYIQTRFNSLANSFFNIPGNVMFGIKIFNRFAVRYHIAIESKLLTEQLCQEIIAPGYGLTVPIVIAAHYAHGMSFLDHTTKWVKIYLVHFARSYMRISTGSTISTAFWHAIYSKVL